MLGFIGSLTDDVVGGVVKTVGMQAARTVSFSYTASDVNPAVNLNTIHLASSEFPTGGINFGRNDSVDFAKKTGETIGDVIVVTGEKISSTLDTTVAIGGGVLKGAWGFVRGTVGGILSLGKSLITHPLRTIGAIGGAAWGGLKYVGGAFTGKNHPVEDIKAAVAAAKVEIDKEYVYKQTWESQDSATAYLAEIGTRGVLEIASLFFGGPAIKGLSKAGAIAKSSRLGKLVAKLEIGKAVDPHKLLKAAGVTSRKLRTQMLDAGFDVSNMPDILSNTVAAERFNKLFQGTQNAGKAFKGRLGNMATRAETMNRAAAMIRKGYDPSFEHMVSKMVNGKVVRKYADIAAFDKSGNLVKFEQLVKELPSSYTNARKAYDGRYVDVREITAYNFIKSVHPNTPIDFIYSGSRVAGGG